MPFLEGRFWILDIPLADGRAFAQVHHNEALHRFMSCKQPAKPRAVSVLQRHGEE